MATPFSRTEFARRLARRSLSEFLDDHCPQLAASIAYHVLFSLFPLAILLAGTGGLIVSATGSRDALIGDVVGALPLSPHGAHQLSQMLRRATGGTAGLGLLGIVGVVYSASGMMAALRIALNQAWDVAQPRPYLKGKLVDVALVALVASVGVASLVLTVAARAGARAGLPPWLAAAVGIAIPLLVAFAVTLFLYRFIPAAHVAFRDAWVPAAGVAAALTGFQNAFAVYLANFGHYNAVYGSLGAVVAFMFFVYLSAELVLLGAEAASEWPQLRRQLRAGERPPEGPPLRRQLRDALAGLWVRRT